MWSHGPDVDPTRVAAGESDEEDEDDEQLSREKFTLAGLTAEEYSEITG